MVFIFTPIGKSASHDHHSGLDHLSDNLLACQKQPTMPMKSNDNPDPVPNRQAQEHDGLNRPLIRIAVHPEGGYPKENPKHQIEPELPVPEYQDVRSDFHSASRYKSAINARLSFFSS